MKIKRIEITIETDEQIHKTVFVDSHKIKVLMDDKDSLLSEFIEELTKKRDHQRIDIDELPF